MPTYDYMCENCKHTFEKFQSITASPTKKCPQCGKMKLNRLIGTGAGIIFKGSGFYQTDYRSENYNQGKTAASKTTETKSTDTKSTETAAQNASTEPKPKDTTKTPATKKENKKTD